MNAPAARSALHPKALNLDDIRPGLEVIVFHTFYGVLKSGTIVRIDSDDVTIDGLTGLFSDDARYLGLVPRVDGGWSHAIFTIAQSDRDLLPVPGDNLIVSGADGEEYTDDEEYESS